ncbi:MAG: bifunctional 5,10-methylenetetrahydrofolate dehydrogenase/5,10-methenyltetrahydrofolate cyclohydrolase [Candidatus Paceibacterota bacterium]
MQIIDGRKIKEEILNELKTKVEALPFPPIFCDILVGDDKVSASYVRIKEKAAESIGIKFKAVNFSASVTTEEILEEIDNLNRVPLLCGIIIQLPLPSGIDKQTVLDAIDPSLDVDCLGSFNSEIFYNIGGNIGYPTALACMKLLDSLDLDLENKNIVVIGRGKLVGLPVTHLLEIRGLKVSVVHSQTENSSEIISNADVIISATGRGKYITGDMVKEGVVIIDAGTSEENGAVVGDVDMESVLDKASFMTPSPGGVGPVTVAMLLENVYKVAQIKIK